MGYRWKRQEKDTGLSAVVYDNRKRPWELHLGDECVAEITNPSHNITRSGPDEWCVSCILHDPFERFTLKRRFTDDEIAAAKTAAKMLYESKLCQRKDAAGT